MTYIYHHISERFILININSMSRNFILTILVVILLASCSGGSPKKVAKHYLDEIGSEDYEGAKDYCTEDTKKLMDMYISLSKLQPDTISKSLNFKITNEKIEGDTAYVYYKVSGSDIEQMLVLKNIDGEWKVAASKDSMGQVDEYMDFGGTNTDTSSANSVEQEQEDTLR